uniref:Elongation of very long chain fatty acids protein n=2 Tax=Caenorhabditis tropicalis TaxID=1561998 RepID=A0A1I7TH07_9PELO
MWMRSAVDTSKSSRILAFLDCFVESSGVRRHDFLGSSQETTHFLALVRNFSSFFRINHSFFRYHHVATFLFFCATYPTPSSQIRVGAIVNLFVHAFMYPYYFIRSMNIKLPSKISMAVTVLQLTQFYTCDTPIFALNSTFALSLSYFVLFANFFQKSYLGGRNKSRSEKKIN